MEKTRISKAARAGSVESNDCLIMISPADTLEIEINSEVKDQYGDLIEASVREKLEELGVDQAKIVVEDRGALDFTIKARVEACVKRGSDIDEKL